MRVSVKMALLVPVFFLVLSCKGRGAWDSRSAVVFSGTGVSAGRPASGLGDYRITYYEAVNAALEEGAGGTVQESDEPFAIADYGPRGELPAEIRRPSLYVVFSQPVVPLARLGAPVLDGTEFFRIEPPLEGVYRWYGSRLLAFECEAETLPQRSYRVTISEKLRSLGGKSLTGERSFSFETERLSALDWSLGSPERYTDTDDAAPADAGKITIIFSYPVNLTEIGRWLEVRAGEKTWPFTLSRPPLPEGSGGGYGRGRAAVPEQGALLTLREALPMDTAVELRVLPGARSEPGWLGMKEGRTFYFHTLRPFSFDRISVRSESSPQTLEGDSIPISLDFSHEVDPQGIEACFSIDGIAQVKKENVHVYGNRVVLNGLPLEYRHEYRVRISGDLKDLWGRPLGAPVTETARVGDANSYVYIRNTGSAMLEAAFPPQVVWEAQNPLEMKRLIAPARGPYEKGRGTLINAAPLPPNSKRYFIEDLGPFLGSGGKGSVALLWEYAVRSSWEPSRIYQNKAWLTVQVTDIGITTRYAYNKVLVWVTRLSSGEPIPNAEVVLLEGETPVASKQSGADGLAVFPLGSGELAAKFTSPEIDSWNDDKEPATGLRIRVREGGGAMAGGDEAEFTPNDSHNLWRFDVDAQESPFTAGNERPVIFLYTDRGLYRPGETITFRGVDRRLLRGRYQNYRGPYTVEVFAAPGAGEGKPIASFSGNTTATGGSFGSFTLPGDLDPGRYNLSYTHKTPQEPPEKETLGKEGAARDVAQTISFQVANFQRLRVESSVDFPDLVYYGGEPLSGRFSASYLAGGSLAGAPYSYYWTREPVAFNPGGKWRNWRFGPELSDGRYYLDQGEGNLDAQGSAGISVIPGSDGTEGAAYRYRLEGSVQDAGRQEISSRNAVMVHPASFYIAARLDPGKLKTANLDAEKSSAYFVPAGDPAAISWALVGPEGPLTEGEGELTAEFVRWDWKQARQAGIGGRVNLIWERVETVVEERSVDLAQAGKGKNAKGGPVSGVLVFTPGEGGQWEARLRSRDRAGRPAFTRFPFYVSGSGWVRWGAHDADAITMTPDKSLYAPGETAKLLVQSPLARGKYLLTLEREGIISEKIIELDGSARTIDIPVEESWAPLVYAALSSFTVRAGKADNSYFEPDLDKPKGVFGITALRVDNASRHYEVEIVPGKGVYAPSEEAEVLLRVKLGGRPAAGVELSFMAVDRGVVDLINYHVPDPLAYFYDPARFPLGVRGADSRSLLIDPVTYALSDLQGGDSEDDSKLEERGDFRPTAVFEPFLVSGADGTVRVKFKLPDSLTTYRCTAVAVGAEAFGIQERDLRVSAPLTAVVAAPFKLRWRDTGRVSLILSNLENGTVEAKVSLGSSNAVLEVDGKGELSLKLGPGETAEASFRVAALEEGPGELVFTLRSPKVNEKILRKITVERPAVYEAVSIMGNLGSGSPFIEEGLALPGAPPGGARNGGFDPGKLTVTVSASRLAMLKDAVVYLLDYPYGCLEQRTARLLPIVAFGDHLASFKLESPIADPKKTVREELALIARNKLPDGSYPYWPGERQGSYFVSLRVGHIAALALAKGYSVPGEIDIPRLLTYLSSSGEAVNALKRDPFLLGYSLWVRAMLGEKIGGEIRSFLGRSDEIGAAGTCFAGLAALELNMKDLAINARDKAKRFIRPAARSLDIAGAGEKHPLSYWGYDTDNYALSLMLFHSLNPGDDMTTRLANSLIDRSRGKGEGIRSNTSSGFWALLAFGRIGDEEKAASGAQSIRVSLGGSALFSPVFESYGGVPVTEIYSLSGSPLAELSRNTLHPLRFERSGSVSGAGRVFYTANLRYGIPAELAGMREEGLGVFVETLDSEGKPVTGGRLAAGKVYTRRVIVSSSTSRTYVALRAPVPSGAEIVDVSFVTSATPPPEGGNTPDPAALNGGFWDEREETPKQFIMDNEVRFHWDYFPPGRKEAVFRFRAVMPGVYPTPPAQAECMYETEVFGRAAGELAVIQ
ncbi:MAG: alpha-2-macroglobulin [Treponema sp.]|jgi:uncharacterized protein YfaS (alpha-2-macroglobulin family)|nr:alpha-2-macroglobulin [Treponema sp.]